MAHSKIIPYGKQHITEEDIEAVVETLRSDFLTQGPKVEEFEVAFAKYVGSKYAVAVANGTAALHLSCLSLNILPGQKVITSPITFAASANCVRYCGAEVVFVDIDPISYLIDIDKVRLLLETSPKGSFAGIIPVDFAGNPVNLEELRNLANKYDLWIIEDACHAPGGYFTDSKGQVQKCGNGKFTELAIFSFHPVKHIATGEGGMITTNNIDLYNRLINLRSHGISRIQDNYENSKELATGLKNAKDYPGWYMEMHELGFNYRLTDIQSALGISQLKSANYGIAKRREIASYYSNEFNEIKNILRQPKIIDGHGFHLYVIEVEDRLGLYKYLKENGILSQVHYFPVHLMPYYQRLGTKEGDFQIAEEYYKRCISLPIFPSMGVDDQKFVVKKIKSYCNE